MNRLNNWKKGRDPCASNWTGILCSETIGTNGYLDVREMYSELSFFHFLVDSNIAYLRTFVKWYCYFLSYIFSQLLNKNLSGSLAPELGQLSRLEILWVLKWNSYCIDVLCSIFHSFSWFSMLPILMFVVLLSGKRDFMWNELTGSIPREIGKLSSLQLL